MRVVNTCTSAVSMTASLSTPALIASWMLATVASAPVQLSWVPARNAYAWPPAAPETLAPVAVFVQIAVPLTVAVVQPGGAQLWLPGAYTSPTAPQSDVV